MKKELRPVEVKLINNATVFKRGDYALGYFHQFVTYTDEDGSETYALVELEDGTMIETYTTYIKFLRW